MAMSRPQEPSSLNRRRPEPGSLSQPLSDHERIIHSLIRSKENTGMWIRDVKQASKLPDRVVDKALKSLQLKNLIKQVVNIQNKGKKHFMAAEFEPSSEITGGSWYQDGNLDTEFIRVLREQCFSKIQKMKVATTEQVWYAINGMGILNVEITMQQISDILKALVLDDEVMEMRSAGSGECASIPVGSVCYRCTSRGAPGKGSKEDGAMASIPCGVCPHIRVCAPDGAINPRDCVYYTKFFEF